VIERTILSDNNDDVLDGSARSSAILIRTRRYGKQAAETELKEHNGRQTNSKTLQRHLPQMLHRIFPSIGRETI
jgi:hypothetical protein